VYKQIGHLSQLEEENIYLLEHKLVEASDLIQTLPTPLLTRKFKFLVHAFDKNLFAEIFPKNPETSRLIDSEDPQSPLQKTLQDGEWPMHILELELIRSYQANKKLEFYIQRGKFLQHVLEISSSPDLSPPQMKMSFFKYIQRPFYVILLVLFWTCSALLLFVVILTFLDPTHSIFSFRSFVKKTHQFWFVCISLLFFLLMMTFAGILNSRLGRFAGIWTDKATDVRSMGYYAGNTSRVLVPMCLFMFQVLQIDNPAFDHIMVNKNILSLVIKKANKFFPYFLFVCYLLTHFNCYSKIKELLGFNSLRFEDRKSEVELIELGKKHLKKLNK
jgi:hypothetical protein